MDVVTRNVLQYLKQHGLLTNAQIVNGGVMIVMDRSRNRFVLAIQRSGPSYFLKQALESEFGTKETVAREAYIYRRSFSDELFAPLRQYLPKLYHFEPQETVLAIEHVESSKNLADIHRQAVRCPTEVARKLGRGMSAYHRITFETNTPVESTFPRKLPWIFELFNQPDLSRLRQRSPACSKLIDLILKTPRFSELLAALSADWISDTLINSDMKWENCLLAPDNLPYEHRRLYMIDWELADIGDAAWDVGSIFQCYVNMWISSMGIKISPGNDDYVSNATVSIESIQEGIVAFWDAYRSGCEEHQNRSRHFLERCARMMAARMLITAYEYSSPTSELDPRAVLMTQTALNVLESPIDTVRALLGIEVSND